VVAVNNAVVDRLEKAVTDKLPAGADVALLGLSYKHGTHIVEESQSIMLAQRLAAKSYKVRLHDPMALPDLPSTFSNDCTLHQDPYEATKGAQAVVLLTDWPQFSTLDWDRIAREAASTPILIDSWRTLKDSKPSLFQYTAIGLGS
jgi:UDPglucose 6-dehydrogenase